MEEHAETQHFKGIGLQFDQAGAQKIVEAPAFSPLPREAKIECAVSSRRRQQGQRTEDFALGSAPASERVIQYLLASRERIYRQVAPVDDAWFELFSASMWFERLTGFPENFPSEVREKLTVSGSTLRSRINGKSWACGELEVVSLSDLRDRVAALPALERKLTVEEVVADVQRLHADEANAHSLFQVASQFNLLEMVSPGVSPEQGVGIYENDFTQGPACAIAAGAGTIHRNYFAEFNGRIGQTESNQIDCLEGLGELLGNTDARLWRMRNGYALATESGLLEISERLRSGKPEELDALRGALKVGIQWDTQVTLPGAAHLVSQVYCSALPVAYCQWPKELWEGFAVLVLEAAYEATFCAGILNARQRGNNRLFLTLLGGGAFGNDSDWIVGAIRRAFEIHGDCGLDVKIVSYRAPDPRVHSLIRSAWSARP